MSAESQIEIEPTVKDQDLQMPALEASQPPAGPPAGVQPAGVAPPGVTPAGTATNEIITAEVTDTLYLRFSNHCRPWELPKDLTVIVSHKAKQYFGENLCGIQQKRLHSETIYQMEFEEPVPKGGHSFEFQFGEKVYQIPLYVHEKKVRDESTTTVPTLLITLKNAGAKQNLAIGHQEFNKIFTDLGLNIIIPTRRQTPKGAVGYNFNRYLVVETPQNLAVIPNQVFVTHPTNKSSIKFNTQFTGQVKRCRWCDDLHAGECLYYEEFKAAKAKREEMKAAKLIVTKIYSDSTARLVNPLGLTAEVMTMSGAALGQLGQAAKDDPAKKDVKNIVILAGHNDTRNNVYKKPEEFCMDVDRSIQKIVQLATTEKDKTVTIVTMDKKDPNVKLDNTIEAHIPKMKQSYISERVNKVVATEQVDNGVNNLFTFNIEMKTDSLGHPDKDETETMIKNIQDEMKTKLIWNKFIATDKLYEHTQSWFKYGCNHCDRYGQEMESREGNRNLCQECHDVVLHGATENPLWNQIYNNKVRELRKARPREDDVNENEGALHDTETAKSQKTTVVPPPT